MPANTVASNLYATPQTAAASGNSGDLDVSAFRELSIDITTTATTGGTVQFFWDRKGADGNYYPLWQSVAFSAASNVLSTSIGPNLAYNQSLGITGRLRWVCSGGNWTFSPSVIGK